MAAGHLKYSHDRGQAVQNAQPLLLCALNLEVQVVEGIGIRLSCKVRSGE